LARRKISASDCRRLALSLPETTEGVHSGFATFHVAGKRFATLGWPDRTSVSLMLDRAEQEVLVSAASEVFSPLPGGWGARGHTRMRLEAADEATVLSGLRAAWRRAAPKRLAAATPGDPEALPTMPPKPHRSR
jgi:hypothetical protein